MVLWQIVYNNSKKLESKNKIIYNEEIKKKQTNTQLLEVNTFGSLTSLTWRGLSRLTLFPSPLTTCILNNNNIPPKLQLLEFKNSLYGQKREEESYKQWRFLQCSNYNWMVSSKFLHLSKRSNDWKRNCMTNENKKGKIG